MNKDLIRDNEGESLGNVGDYVERFKKMGDEGSNNHFSPQSSIYSVTRASSLPEKWEKKTEKEILVHYYQRFGDTTLKDFKSISGKIASNINRLYVQKFTPEDIYNKLTKIPKKELEYEAPSSSVRPSASAPSPSKKVTVKIKERNYPYKKGLSRLNSDQLELCQFVDEKKLCFSSDEEGFFLTIKVGEEKSFDNLFNFTPKEKLVYEMFSEQLGDSTKAKKLVLMSRILNTPEDSPTPPIKKKRGRPQKKVSSLAKSCSG